MPEEIVARLLRLPGYGVYRWDADEAANTLTLWVPPDGRVAGLPVRGLRAAACGAQLDGAAAAGLAVGDVGGVAGGGGASRPLSPLRVARNGCLRRQQGPLHDAAGGGGGRGLSGRPVSRVGQQGASRRNGPAHGRACPAALGGRAAALAGALSRRRQDLLGKTVSFLTVVSDLDGGTAVGRRERQRETLTSSSPRLCRPRSDQHTARYAWTVDRSTSACRRICHALIVYDKFHVLRHAGGPRWIAARNFFSRRQKLMVSSAASAHSAAPLSHLDGGTPGPCASLFAVDPRFGKAYLLEQLAQLNVRL